jgi:hypothetical protein
MSGASARVHLADAPVRSPAPALSQAANVPASRASGLDGTLHGTFFAHTGNIKSGTIYSLFGSGKLGSVGPTLLVGGFQKSGFTATGAGGGNLVLAPEVHPGNVFIRLTELSGPSATSPGQYQFAYDITQGAGVHKNLGQSGTVEITLQPINTNIHGQRVSNPGFFGNSTLTFQPGTG